MRRHGPARAREITEALAASLYGRFGSYELPKKHHFVEEPFSVAGGLLTQTLKLKRRQIVARYQAELERLYRA